METSFEHYMAYKAKVMAPYLALDTYFSGLLNVSLEEFAAMTDDEQEQAILAAFEAERFLSS